MPKLPEGGHSSVVRLWLEWDGESIELVQLAPRWAVARSPCDIRPGPAEVVVEIDGDRQRRPVHLGEGASASGTRISFTPSNRINEAAVG